MQWQASSWVLIRKSLQKNFAPARKDLACRRPRVRCRNKIESQCVDALRQKKTLTTTRRFVAAGGVVLGFALQDATRASQLLASLTSSRFCLRFVGFLRERRISQQVLHRASRAVRRCGIKERLTYDRPSHVKNLYRNARNQAGAFA